MVEITLLRDNTAGCVRLQSQRQLPVSILCSMHDNSSSLFDVSLAGAPAAGKKSVQPIRAHKAILAHASPHLHDLFTSQGYVDSNKSKYTISSIDHGTLGDIVKLIYTDNVLLAENGAAERVRGILSGAKYLIMQDLTDACETFLASSDQIDVNNCIDVFQFAFKYKCTKISTAVCAFIAKNLVGVSQSTKFLNLSRDECAKFLLSDPVIAASADDRCRAAIAWLNHESPSRAESAECIMSMASLDAAGVTPETLLLAARSPIIRPTIKGFISTLVDAMANNIQRTSQVESEQKKKQKLEETRGEAWYVVGGLGNGQEFYRYDVARRQWSTLPDLPWERVGGACAVGTRLIVMGGCKDDDGPTIDIDEFDTVTQTWSTSEAKFNGVRRGMAVTADSKHAYALGGLISPSTMVTGFADRYTAETRKMKKLTGMAIERYKAVAVSKNDEMVFVVGGLVGKSREESCACNTIDKYEHASSTWSTISTLKSIRVDAAAFLGDNLYMAGGFCRRSSRDNMQILNTRTGRLRAAPQMMYEREDCRAVALDSNVICILGGRCSFSHFENYPVSSVETLDVREGKWTTGNIVPDIPKGNANFGFAHVLP